MRAARSFLVAILILPLSFGLADYEAFRFCLQDVSTEEIKKSPDTTLPVIPAATFGLSISFLDAIVNCRPDDRVSKQERSSSFLSRPLSICQIGGPVYEVFRSSIPLSFCSDVLASLSVVRLRF